MDMRSGQKKEVGLMLFQKGLTRLNNVFLSVNVGSSLGIFLRPPQNVELELDIFGYKWGPCGQMQWTRDYARWLDRQTESALLDCWVRSASQCNNTFNDHLIAIALVWENQRCRNKVPYPLRCQCYMSDGTFLSLVNSPDPAARHVNWRLEAIFLCIFAVLCGGFMNRN